MKKSYILPVCAALLCAAAACNEDPVTVNEGPVKTIVRASLADTRTSVASDGAYSWVSGDEINVFTSDGAVCPSVFTALSSGRSVEFEGSKAAESDLLRYAIYPASATSATTISDGVIPAVIPTEQDGTIANAISVATSDDSGSFSFVNACSVIKLSFNAADRIRYARIEFTSPIAGSVNVNAADGSISGASAYTVSISSDAAFSGDKYIAVAPASKGKLILYFRDLDGNTAIKTATVSKSFTAGTIKNLGTVSGLTFIEGALPGLFSTQDNSRKYLFSKGNLMYQASTNTFSFAGTQYSKVGAKAGNTTANDGSRQTQSALVDLFCWGTSGYSYGASRYQPWRIWSTDGSSCGSGMSSLSGNMDWGYNAIAGGGNTENYGWSTPSVGDFNYLTGNVSGRTTRRYTKGTLAGVKGFFFLPDVWTCPAGVKAPASYNDKAAAWDSNSWSAADWALLEDSGVVFFPCIGWIGTGGAYNGDGTQFKYWSSVASDATRAYLMSYNNGTFTSNDYGTRSSQAGVRLVYKMNF